MSLMLAMRLKVLRTLLNRADRSEKQLDISSAQTHTHTFKLGIHAVKADLRAQTDDLANQPTPAVYEQRRHVGIRIVGNTLSVESVPVSPQC